MGIMKTWNTESIPDLSGKTALITGGNTGLGFQSARELARRHALVVIACRSLAKGERAVFAIRESLGREAALGVLPLDLADHASVRDCAEAFKARYDRLDILMNNAGVVNKEERGETPNGSETQMGTNHFGHFLLTSLLADALRETPGSRVVTMSSGAYKSARLDFEDLDWKKRPYHRMRSYGDSKLANLLFTRKLQEYFARTGTDSMALSAHPGLSASPRQQSIGIGGPLSKRLASPLSRGSRPQLLAATAPFVAGGEFYGPKYGIDGPPVRQKIRHKQYTREIADRLWRVSEERTGARWP